MINKLWSLPNDSLPFECIKTSYKRFERRSNSLQRITFYSPPSLSTRQGFGTQMHYSPFKWSIRPFMSRTRGSIYELNRQKQVLNRSEDFKTSTLLHVLSSASCENLHWFLQINSIDPQTYFLKNSFHIAFLEQLLLDIDLH